jgi:hypothetical protein
MTRDELKTALQERLVDPRAYDLSDTGKNETEIYVLRPRQSGVIGKPNYWVIFYSERGLETGRRDFPSESAACQHFLEWVSADPTTRRG